VDEGHNGHQRGDIEGDDRAIHKIENYSQTATVPTTILIIGVGAYHELVTLTSKL